MTDSDQDSEIFHFFSRNHYGLPADNDVFDPEILQGWDNTCAIKSQHLILKDFGFQGSEAQLVEEAVRNGWYSPADGTSSEHVGKLLASHGVGCAVYHHANVYDLINAVSHGRRVIILVDSNELHNDSALWHLLEGLKDESNPNPNHALLVSGVDLRDVNNPLVVLTDPGTGQAAVSYPMQQLVNAWADSKCTMVVTRDPAPYDFNPVAMSNFDYDEGHIPYFSQGVDFDSWQADCQDRFSSFFDPSGVMAVNPDFMDVFNPVRIEGLLDGVLGEADSGALSGVGLSNFGHSGADLPTVDFPGADFSGVDLPDVDLSGADFSGVDLPDVDLSGIDLSDVDIDLDGDSVEGLFSGLSDIFS